MKSHKSIRKYGRNTRKKNYKGGVVSDHIHAIREPVVNDNVVNDNVVSDLVVSDECPICMDKIVGIYTHPECNKKFHMKCITKWCKNKKKCPCPICRQEVVISNDYEMKYKDLDESFKKIQIKNKEMEKDISYLIEENDALKHKTQNRANKFSR
jgi:SUMO ligase MMS21 Smc5/6 complex component